jgi:SHS2 domain-containing protein
MAGHCETFDHTADVGLQATADTLGELFEALAEGLADFICPRGKVAAAQTRELIIRAEDVEALVVDFLCKVLNVIQTDRFVIAGVSVKEITGQSVRAEVSGERYDPLRHELHTEVKAVTYHLLKVAREGGQWLGRVVLDL